MPLTVWLPGPQCGSGWFARLLSPGPSSVATSRAASALRSSFSLRSASSSHFPLHGRGNEAGYRAAEFEYFLDQPRAEIRIGFGCHQEDGFDFRRESSVHQRHLQLEFVVGDGANATDDHLRLLLTGIMDQKSIEGIDAHV